MSTRQLSVDRASVRREEYLVVRVVLRVSELTEVVLHFRRSDRCFSWLRGWFTVVVVMRCFLHTFEKRSSNLVHTFALRDWRHSVLLCHFSKLLPLFWLLFSLSFFTIACHFLQILHSSKVLFLALSVTFCCFGPIANLKGHYFQPSLSVSLSVCLCVSDRHFYPSALTDFDETWTKLGHKDPTLI